MNNRSFIIHEVLALFCIVTQHTTFASVLGIILLLRHLALIYITGNKTFKSKFRFIFLTDTITKVKENS